MKLLLLVSIVSFVLYIGFVFIKYGVPASISESYYLLPTKVGHIVFFTWTVLVALPLMVYGVSVSPDVSKFAIFYCGVFLIFVGTAAQFKEDFVRKYHFIFAGVCAGLSLIWILLTVPFGIFFVLGLGAIGSMIGVYVKGVNAESVERNSLVTFLELACFLGTYVCMSLV